MNIFDCSRLRRFFVCPCCVLLFCSAALLPADESARPKTQQRSEATVLEAAAPEWRVELRNLIGSEPLGIVVGRGRETKGKPHSALVFTDNETVVVTFVIRDGEPKLSERGNVGANVPLQLRGLFFNAQTGELKGSSAWPTESIHSSVVAAHNGNFVTQRGTVLTLYDAGKTEQKRLQLSGIAEGGWASYPSPSGQTLLFTPSGLSVAPVAWVLVSFVNLEVVRTWAEIRSGWVGISDDAVAMTTCVWIYDCTTRVEAKKFGGEWHSVGIADRKNAPHPVFVSADNLYLTEYPARLVRTNGKVDFEDGRFDRCFWGTAITAASGDRFAVPACRLRGASSALDLGGLDVLTQIRIYDAPYAGLSRQVAIGGPKIIDLAYLALSPDGRKLAILNGLSLEVVELPQINEK